MCTLKSRLPKLTRELHHPTHATHGNYEDPSSHSSYLMYHPRCFILFLTNTVYHLLFPLYWWGNWGATYLGVLPKDTQLVTAKPWCNPICLASPPTRSLLSHLWLSSPATLDLGLSLFACTVPSSPASASAPELCPQALMHCISHPSWGCALIHTDHYRCRRTDSSSISRTGKRYKDILGKEVLSQLPLNCTTQESEIPVTREASWRRTSRYRHKQLYGTAKGTFWRGGFC